MLATLLNMMAWFFAIAFGLGICSSIVDMINKKFKICPQRRTSLPLRSELRIK